VRLLASSGQIDTTHPTAGNWPIQIDLDTVYNTLIVCGLMIALAVYLRSRYSERNPGKFQTALEWIIEFLQGLIKDTLGAKPINIGPIAISMFFFILVSNLIGLLPVFKSPTNDINTTIALALFSIFLLHYYSIRFRSFRGYIKHYFSIVQPRWTGPWGWTRIVFAFLEGIQEASRPITLSFRLYFNIFVGELMVALIISLLPAVVAPFFGGVWLLFSIFVSLVQAFIFTMLTIAYIAMGTDVEHEEEHGEAGAAEERRGVPIATTDAAAA
jgi:F-type H+-transporting ATPase subunit a